MKVQKGKRIAILVGVLAVVVPNVGTWLSWPHLRFWWLFEPLGPNAQGHPEYRHRQAGIILAARGAEPSEMSSRRNECEGPGVLG